jgi:hypothetical protein
MHKALMAVSVMFLASATAAGAVTTIDEDFAGYAPGTVLNAPDSLFGAAWATVDGTVDYIVSGSSFGGLCRGDAACIDLDGSSGNAGVFSAGSPVETGTYLLSFLLYGSGRGSTEDVTVSLGDYTTTFTIGSAGSEEVIEALVMVGAGGSLLSFSNAGGDNIGALLTRVSLTPEGVTAIPIPSSLPLLFGALAGLAGLAAMRRRA